MPQRDRPTKETSHKKGGGGKSNRGGHNLGRALVKQQFNQARVGEYGGETVLETERGKHKLRSVTDCGDLEELMSTAALAGTDFTARRGEVVVLASGVVHEPAAASAAQPEELDLPVPRRPAWVAGQSAEALDQDERAAFLEWRRGLATLEEGDGMMLTPFEKNLEVWRQLWRVLERSQLVVQIVDARNPLLFRCIDLERYVAELCQVKEKRSLLLVNKADLLTPEQRTRWADYFNKHRIPFLFFSAVVAQTVLDGDGVSDIARHAAPPTAPPGGDGDGGDGDAGDGDGDGDAVADDAPPAAASSSTAAATAAAAADDDDEGSEEESEDEDEDAALARMVAGKRFDGGGLLPAAGDDDDEEEEEEGEGGDEGEAAEGDAAGAAAAAAAELAASAAAVEAVRTAAGALPATHVHSREDLLAVLMRLCPELKGSQVGPGGERFVVGLVGYPNVGKSSTVNVLVAQKKTSVSATPGKTKHFQTLRVPDVPALLLCDCPGLVFPTVAGSKAQMLCDGILPADQMRDCMPPIRRLYALLGPPAFFHAYGVRLRTDAEREDDADAPEPARELLMAHAIARGYMTTTKGSPDVSRSARILIKDFINAKLLYCTPPPDGADDGTELDAAAAAAAAARHPPRRQPRAPTAQRYLEQMREDFEKQETSAMGRAGAAAPSAGVANNPPNFRPTGQPLVADRVVARGPRVQ